MQAYLTEISINRSVYIAFILYHIILMRVIRA